MTRLRLTLFVVALSAGVAAVSVPAESLPPVGESVVALVDRLGSREYAERERATKALIARGESVLPAVREAANRSPNPEVRWRASRAWDRILRAAAVSKSTGMAFVVVLPGEFTMGAPAIERGRRFDEREHPVRLTHRFLIGKHEVTQAEYEAATELKPSHFAATGDGKGKVGLKTDTFPVENVTWFDAVAFCNALSKKDGFPEFYTLTDVKREAGAIASATVKTAGGNGYRLPTEAEWEYACRAGTDTAFHFGPRSRGEEGNFKTVINAGGYGGTTTRPSKGHTTAVGEYKPNRWGLYDMHGNVAEWCDDWYDAGYDDRKEDDPITDPTGPKTGRHKVARGGSWFVEHTSCRSASRHPLTPDEKKNYVGFRVARTP